MQNTQLVYLMPSRYTFNSIASRFTLKIRAEKYERKIKIMKLQKSVQVSCNPLSPFLKKVQEIQESYYYHYR